MGVVDDLSRLEASHGIEREAPRLILEHAKALQSSLEDLAERHSCELPAWAELAGSLEARQARVSAAVDLVLAETMELDDAVFGVLSRDDCLEILRSLKGEFARALENRSECARTLVAIAEAYREDGYPGSELLDRAIDAAVLQVREQAKVSPSVAVEYIHLLADVCGVRPTPGVDGDKKFPDLSSRIGGQTNDAVAENANRIQQIALGLWPRTTHR